MGFTTLFAKGVLCNWLVCLAVWMAMASNSIPGKLLSIFIPISTFVTLGFEHSVANMYAVSTLSPLAFYSILGLVLERDQKKRDRRLQMMEKIQTKLTRRPIPLC